MSRPAELLPEFGVLRPDLQRALNIQRNVLKARALGLLSTLESNLASFTVQSASKPPDPKPKVQKQRVRSQPVRSSSRIAAVPTFKSNHDATAEPFTSAGT